MAAKAKKTASPMTISGSEASCSECGYKIEGIESTDDLKADAERHVRLYHSAAAATPAEA